MQITLRESKAGWTWVEQEQTFSTFQSAMSAIDELGCAMASESGVAMVMLHVETLPPLESSAAAN